MRYACQLPKDSPILTDVRIISYIKLSLSIISISYANLQFAGKTKKEMVDFVSFYRRFQGISGMNTNFILCVHNFFCAQKKKASLKK